MVDTDDDDATRSDRRARHRKRSQRRFLALVLAIVLLAAVVIVGVLFIRDDSDATKSPTTSSTAASAAAADAEAAAKKLYATWLDGDRAAAATYATDEAVHQLFEIDTADADGLVFTACSDADGGRRCVWSRPGGELAFTVVRRQGRSRVTAVTYGPAALPPENSTSSTSDPTATTSGIPSASTLPMPADPEGFATTLFAYWKLAQPGAATQVATPDAITQMFSVPFSDSANPYTFAGCKGVGGNASCTFSADGLPTIVMTVPIGGGGVPVAVDKVERTD